MGAFNKRNYLFFYETSKHATRNFVLLFSNTSNFMVFIENYQSQFLCCVHISCIS